jgi:hypothetical protein
MTYQYLEFPDEAIIEFTVAGKATREEFDELAPRIEAFIADHGAIRLIEVIEDFKGFEPSLLWEGAKFDMKNLKHISHCAVVSDTGWMGPLVRLSSAVIPTSIRTFKLAELDAARAWIRNPDG